MGFEDEVEQSLERLAITYELTSSIVPLGTSFHRAVELGFSPIAFDPERFSCSCDLSGPADFGAVNPDAVHDRCRAVQPQRRPVSVVGAIGDKFCDAAIVR
jgi:hypothetical protein